MCSRYGGYGRKLQGKKQSLFANPSPHLDPHLDKTGRRLDEMRCLRQGNILGRRCSKTPGWALSSSQLSLSLSGIAPLELLAQSPGAVTLGVDLVVFLRGSWLSLMCFYQTKCRLEDDPYLLPTSDSFPSIPRPIPAIGMSVE